MSRQFYSNEDLERSRRLYANIKAWAKTRGDVNLIGGWAVKELVQGVAMDSRDVDLILHTQGALDSFRENMPRWGLVWRKKGRIVYKECHLKEQNSFPPIVDIFTSDASIGASLFTTLAATNVKPPMGKTWLPPVRALLRDKIVTVPLRSGPDKYAKDLLDVWSLVFKNKAGELPSDLLTAATFQERLRAAARIPDSRTQYPEFKDLFKDVDTWLRTS